MNLLGIDQGSTKTLAVVAGDDGRILGRGLGPGACHFYDGMEKAMRAAQEAAQAAMRQAGVGTGEIGTVSAGMAGANFPEEIDALQAGLRGLFGLERVQVVNDCLIALRAGTDRPCCAVICAGTGLNAAIRTPDGNTFIYNNYVEDDDQGANGLGVRMLRAVFQSQIGALPSTALTTRLLSFFELESVDGLLLAFQRGKLRRPPKDACPILFEAAREADPVALDVIAGFGRSVSRYVAGGIAKYGLHGTEIEVVLSGGIFKAGCRLLVDSIGAEIHRAAPLARILQAPYEPVVGAALLALDEWYGGTIPAQVMANCQASAQELGLLRVIDEQGGTSGAGN
jgi:N-acetylglucosamine kinase-like BadF-type ATPase